MISIIHEEAFIDWTPNVKGNYTMLQGRIHWASQGHHAARPAYITLYLRFDWFIFLVSTNNRDHFLKQNQFILQNSWGIISFKMKTLGSQKNYIVFLFFKAQDNRIDYKESKTCTSFLHGMCHLKIWQLCSKNAITLFSTHIIHLFRLTFGLKNNKTLIQVSIVLHSSCSWP